MINRRGKVCRIEAPCKINLHLSVARKRPDGFHDIESLFASLALSDTLEFTISGGEGVCILTTNTHEPSVAEGDRVISTEDNLVYKAVSLFRRRTGYKDGLAVNLTKRIPMGAGLGGGSSDAASTLLALNALSGHPCPDGELAEMAAVLGSDVPFFLTGGLAFISGRGERIKPVKTEEIPLLAPLSVVLVKPPFSSDTAAAYRLLDEARENARGVEGKPLAAVFPCPQSLISHLQKDLKTWPFFNDFLPVFLAGKGEKPLAYKAILDGLQNAGASFVSLSGSGSCCFGVFPSQEMAKKALKGLAVGGNFVELTFFLANRANTVVE